MSHSGKVADQPEIYILDWGVNENPADTGGYRIQKGFRLRNSGSATARNVIVEVFGLSIPDQGAVSLKSNPIAVIGINEVAFAPIYREGGAPLDRWELEEHLHATYQHAEVDQTITLKISYYPFDNESPIYTLQPLIYSPRLRRVRFGPPVPNALATSRFVFSLHGIRTRGAWQKDVTPLLNTAGFKVVPLDYGYFLAVQLLIEERQKQKNPVVSR